MIFTAYGVCVTVDLCEYVDTDTCGVWIGAFTSRHYLQKLVKHLLDMCMGYTCISITHVCTSVDYCVCAHRTVYCIQKIVFSGSV